MLFFWLFAIRLAANGRNVKNYVWKWWKNFWINTPQNSICTTSFHSFVTLARSFSLSVIISHCSCLLLWKSHDEDNRKQKVAQINATICEKKKKKTLLPIQMRFDFYGVSGPYPEFTRYITIGKVTQQSFRVVFVVVCMVALVAFWFFFHSAHAQNVFSQIGDIERQF